MIQLVSPPSRIYQSLYQGLQYEPKVSKAKMLSHPAYRYIHALLTRTVAGCGYSTGVLGRLNLLYLHSMAQSEPIHLEYIVPDYIRHQRQYHRVEVLFACTYITASLGGWDWSRPTTEWRR